MFTYIYIYIVLKTEAAILPQQRSQVDVHQNYR